MKFIFKIINQTTITTILAVIISMPIFMVFLSWLFPNYELISHFSTTILPDLAISTGILLVGVAFGVILIGTVLAYLVVLVEFPGRKYLEYALFLPFTIPAYVLAFVYLGVFDYSGYVQTFFRDIFAGIGFSGFDIRSGYLTIILIFVLAFYPYVYMLARASFSRQKLEIIESGKLLGLNAFSVFWRISLPIARPAIFAGTLITLMEVLADFGVVSLFNFDTFTTAIYSSWEDFRSIETATQLSSILVLIAFLLIHFEKKARGEAKYYSTDVLNYQLYKPSGITKWLITGFVLLWFMLSFIMPVLQLIIWTYDSYSYNAVLSYVNNINSSVILMVGSTFLIILIATMLVLFSRDNNTFINNMLIRISTLGYALPGSIMAIGLLYVIQQISAVSIYFGGQSINYLIYGSIFLLLWAYISRFMATAYNSIDASIEHIKPSYISSARLLGIGRIGLFMRIYLPIMLPSILAASLLVGVDILKELPATYLLRPYGFDTLAIKVYELSAEGLFEAASIPAIIMILISMLLLLLVQILTTNKRYL